MLTHKLRVVMGKFIDWRTLSTSTYGLSSHSHNSMSIQWGSPIYGRYVPKDLASLKPVNWPCKEPEICGIVSAYPLDSVPAISTGLGQANRPRFSASKRGISLCYLSLTRQKSTSFDVFDFWARPAFLPKLYIGCQQQARRLQWGPLFRS